MDGERSSGNVKKYYVTNNTMSEKATGINESGGTEPAEIGTPSQVSEGSDDVLSSGEDVDAAETTEEMAEIPAVSDGEAEMTTTTTGPSPLVAEESDDIILSVDDEDPAAAEIKEDHDHEAEIFAGFSLESNGIRFRGPKSGKTVRGGLLLYCFYDVHMICTLFCCDGYL